MNPQLARLLGFAKNFLRTLSRPRRLAAVALALAFALSLLSWALGDRLTSYALFFPRREGSGLASELRELPRRSGLEAKAELLASEILLGPLDPSLGPAFPPGVRVSSVLLRKGRLYIDLSEEAALSGRDSIELGKAAIERSLALGLRGPRSFLITIGGREAYAQGLAAAAPPEAKKEQNN